MQSHNNNLQILIKKSVSILLFFNLFPWKAYFTHNVTNTQKLKQSTSSQLLDQASGPLEIVQELILIHHITISIRLLLLEILLIFILWIHYLTYTTLDFCFAFLFFIFLLSITLPTPLCRFYGFFNHSGLHDVDQPDTSQPTTPW